MTSFRRAVQLLALLLFILLLAATTWPLRSPLSPQLFLRADPLAAVSLLSSLSLNWLALFWPALVVLGATALLGRVYCGWVCPLGTCIDLTDRLLRPLRRAGRRLPPPRSRYAILGLSLGAGLLGGHLVWLADPIALLTRVFATVAFVGARQGYNAALPAAQPLLRALHWRWQPVEVHPLGLAAVTLAGFLLVLLLGLAGRRGWCRTLCPLGALLSLAGRCAPGRRQVGEGCTGCGACARQCPFSAIGPETPRETAADCARCGRCISACPPRVTTLGLGPVGESLPLDAGRREFVLALAAGAGYGLAARAGVRVGSPPLPLRPPGAIVRDSSGAYLRAMTEEEFLSKCLRCGQCLKACITGGLQPATHEAGLLGFYTPVLQPRLGWCEQGCAACGAVCPAGALLPFAIEEKPHLPIGQARIDQSRCLAWGQGENYRQCLVCDEHCSYSAIQMIRRGGQERPLVDTERCTGCGQCEHACPARPEPAITVHRQR